MHRSSRWTCPPFFAPFLPRISGKSWLSPSPLSSRPPRPLLGRVVLARGVHAGRLFSSDGARRVMLPDRCGNARGVSTHATIERGGRTHVSALSLSQSLSTRSPSPCLPSRRTQPRPLPGRGRSVLRLLWGDRIGNHRQFGPHCRPPSSSIEARPTPDGSETMAAF